MRFLFKFFFPFVIFFLLPFKDKIAKNAYINDWNKKRRMDKNMINAMIENIKNRHDANKEMSAGDVATRIFPDFKNLVEEPRAIGVIEDLKKEKLFVAIDEDDAILNGLSNAELDKMVEALAKEEQRRLDSFKKKVELIEKLKCNHQIDNNIFVAQVFKQLKVLKTKERLQDLEDETAPPKKKSKDGEDAKGDSSSFLSRFLGR
jgi:hypothetical protein